MATARKLTDNHLTCVICTEVFTDPATLHCNHTFCKSCLLKYTKTQSEAIQAKSVPCPSCRQQTKVTNPDSPVEEWVSQLKPSHVIQGLMDDFGPGTEATEIRDDFRPVTEAPLTRKCSVCRNQQKQTPATSWCFDCDSSFCDGCLTLHGAMPFSRDHEVVELCDSTKSKMTLKRPFMCNDHDTKQIELYCKECQVAICTLCCSKNHRKCQDVDTIENMTPQVREHLTKWTQELQVRIGNIKHGIAAREKHADDFRNKIEEVKSQIRNMRTKVAEMMLMKESQLFCDVDQSSTQYLEQIQSDMESREIRLQMYQQQCEFTTNVITSSCEMDMYAVYEFVCGVSSESEVTDNGPAPRKVVFRHNMDKLSKAADELHLGDVIIVQDACDRESVPTLYQTIDCEKVRGMVNPDLNDVIVLTVDGVDVVVVVDCDNNRLNTYYTHDIHSHKYIKLSAAPWRITQLTDWKVAVSVPYSNEIVTVKVYPLPVIQSTIKTNNPYYGLASLSPSLLVAGGTGSTDILDMKGNVLKSINIRKVSTPSYIHVTRNQNLIVSHGLTKSLVSMTSGGKAVFTYTPIGDRALKFPRGITSTNTGDILLADRDSHKVIQLTESGEFVRDVLTAQDGIYSPRGICLDTNGLLYITCGNCVKIFRFQTHFED